MRTQTRGTSLIQYPGNGKGQVAIAETNSRQTCTPERRVRIRATAVRLSAYWWRLACALESSSRQTMYHRMSSKTLNPLLFLGAPRGVFRLVDDF